MPEVTAARGVGAGAGERTRDREETLTRDREETEIRPADQAGACVASDADGQAQAQPSDRIAPLRTFEEFNDQRKAAFLKVKDFKQADGRLVGYLCSSTHLEMIDAAGASAVGLCGTSDEVIPATEEVLPANLCPLIMSTYGFAYSQKCPFTYFSDFIVGETAYDGKKKMFELLGELKPVHVLRLPQSREHAYEREGWVEECRLLKERLERLFGVAIADYGTGDWGRLTCALRRSPRCRGVAAG